MHGGRPSPLLIVGPLLTGLLMLDAGCVSFLAYETGHRQGGFLRVALAGPDYDPCDPVTNGCGPEGLLGLLVPECPMEGVCFTPACNAHDLCYVTCGSSRSACDDQFGRDLNAICRERFREGDPHFEHCLALAYIYWQAVVRLGQSFFDEGQISGCCCAAPEDSSSAVAGRFAVRPPFEDRDDDLMPDGWELEVGCDPTDPSDALVDFDLDGLLNLEEFIHDTHPMRTDPPPAGE
jgi:hypothetical protein